MVGYARAILRTTHSSVRGAYPAVILDDRPNGSCPGHPAPESRVARRECFTALRATLSTTDRRPALSHISRYTRIVASRRQPAARLMLLDDDIYGDISGLRVSASLRLIL